jgi:hypothetical protein
MERIMMQLIGSRKLLSMGLLPLFVPFIISSSVSLVQPSAASNELLLNNPEVEIAFQELYFQEKIHDLYQEMDLSSMGLSFEVFSRGYIGYLNLKDRQALSAKPILTLVDFEKPSTEKRLWILDLDNREVLVHTLVAHGRGSGDTIARFFSNIVDSHMSSLGFYVTAGTYYGQHGLSLKLEGKDKDFNCRALERHIVVHGARYVSQECIRQHGRLGRSHGCPALPTEETAAIIELIKDQTTFFIHGPEENYESEHLNQATARQAFFNTIARL